MSFELVKLLVKKNMRVFNTEQARTLAQELDLSPNAIADRLYQLKQRGMIEPLMKGLYCLSPEFLKGIPIHEYEIGLALASPSCIAYLSAFSYHKLTDQLSSLVYVMSPLISQKTFSKNLYKIKGIRYRVVRIKSDDYFGVVDQWAGQQKLKVTDLEKTLIDGLLKPKYCGGFREVLDAFEQSIHNVELPKIISYAQRLSDVTSRRLGWILSHFKVNEKHLKPLLEKRSSGFSKLDPSGSSKGPWNKTWLLQENL